MKYASRITARFVASGHLHPSGQPKMTTPATAADLPGSVRVPQLTNTDRRFFNFRTGFAAATSSGDEPVGSRRESLIEPPVTTLYSVQKDACVLLSTCRPAVQPVRHAARLPHAKRLNGRQTDVAPQPVLCRDIRFSFFTAAARMGSLSGPG